MFGLSTREMLKKVILNLSRNNLDIYKSGIKKNIEKLNCGTETEVNEILFEVRKEYLDSVMDSVISSFRAGSPQVADKMFMLLLSPKMCGYDIDLDSGVMAGSVYAISYYAIKNKKARAKDCVRLNHLQNDIINEMLKQLDSEMS